MSPEVISRYRLGFRDDAALELLSSDRCGAGLMVPPDPDTSTPVSEPQPASNQEIPELAAYPPVMTVQQVAEVLQINDQVVRRRLNAGDWPGFRAGTRDWRMRRLTVRAIILGDLVEHQTDTSEQSTSGEEQKSESSPGTG